MRFDIASDIKSRLIRTLLNPKRQLVSIEVDCNILQLLLALSVPLPWRDRCFSSQVIFGLFSTQLLAIPTSAESVLAQPDMGFCAASMN
jgi:hypothetical protein